MGLQPDTERLLCIGHTTFIHTILCSSSNAIMQLCNYAIISHKTNYFGSTTHTSLQQWIICSVWSMMELILEVLGTHFLLLH